MARQDNDPSFSTQIALTDFLRRKIAKEERSGNREGTLLQSLFCHNLGSNYLQTFERPLPFTFNNFTNSLVDWSARRRFDSGNGSIRFKPTKVAAAVIAALHEQGRGEGKEEDKAKRRKKTTTKKRLKKKVDGAGAIH